MAETRDLTLMTATAAIASADGTAFDISRMHSGVFYLSVTAVTGGADTLDVKLQDSPDGTTWYDVGTAFTQATAATSERKALTNLGRFIRAVSTVGAGATVSFTVKATLHDA